ncbi:AraC family transcriptional regulator [Rugamonas fusca]|nr:AraC family transcriptional regulator [Rugamonas fusca]
MLETADNLFNRLNWICMDNLSHLLALYPVHSALDTQCRFGSDWAIEHAVSAAGIAPYHLMMRGHAYLDIGERSRIALEPGDIVLFPSGQAHRLYSVSHSGAPVPPPIEENDGPLRLLHNAGTAPETGILCGQFEFQRRGANPLLGELPDVVHIRTRERGDLLMLRTLIDMLKLETDGARPAASAVISQLASALFALLMRAWVEQAGQTECRPSLFSLLSERRLQPALKAIFSAPERPWQLAELAAACHMSRATFARVFQKRANATPAEFLLRMRMAKAATLLADPQLPMGDVAEQVGYQSEAAFNRVFKRHFGTGPGAYRRDARGGGMAIDERASLAAGTATQASR